MVDVKNEKSLALSQQLIYNHTRNIREAEVAALELVGQLCVVHSQEME